MPVNAAKRIENMRGYKLDQTAHIRTSRQVGIADPIISFADTAKVSQPVSRYIKTRPIQIMGDISSYAAAAVGGITLGLIAYFACSPLLPVMFAGVGLGIAAGFALNLVARLFLQTIPATLEFNELCANSTGREAVVPQAEPDDSEQLIFGLRGALEQTQNELQEERNQSHALTHKLMLHQVAAGMQREVMGHTFSDRNLTPDPGVEPKYFGEYETVRLLAGGTAQGDVYVAKSKTGAPVIIKRLKIDPSLDPGQREYCRQRFIREIEILKRLQHPNLLSIHEYQIDNEPVYYVAEYVPGAMSLQNYLHIKQSLPLLAALLILYHVVLGLEAASDENNGYAHGVVHRDMKPANIMISPLWYLVKIIDFGIARDLLAGKDLTYTGTVMGSDYYLAPEIHDTRIGAKNLDHRADIFALGIILFEMLTGRYPYKLPRISRSADPQAVYRAQKAIFAGSSNIFTDEALDRLPAECRDNAALRALFKRLGEKNRDFRLGSYREFRAAIEDLMMMTA